MKHICECRRRGCRSWFGLSYREYVRLTARGQRIVAAGHTEPDDFVAETVCDGKALVIGRPRKVRVVMVACPECGEKRQSSERNAYRIKAGLLSGKCGWCRNPNRVKPAHLQPVEPGLSSEYHQFWRDRFTQKELNELWAAVSLYLDVPEVKAA